MQGVPQHFAKPDVGQVNSLPLFPPYCPQMAPELLPVLINALSEQGAFQQGGQPVPTTREPS